VRNGIAVADANTRDSIPAIHLDASHEPPAGGTICPALQNNNDISAFPEGSVDSDIVTELWRTSESVLAKGYPETYDEYLKEEENPDAPVRQAASTAASINFREWPQEVFALAKELISVSISVLDAFPEKDNLDRQTSEAITLAMRELVALAVDSNSPELEGMYCKHLLSSCLPFDDLPISDFRTDGRMLYNVRVTRIIIHL
jgi:hypothetical protein